MSDRADFGENVIPLPNASLGGGGGSGVKPPYGGGGSGGSFESRIARLEADSAHILETLKGIKSELGETNKSLTDMKVSIGKIEVKLDDKPSKAFIISASLAVTGAITALIAYAETIRNLLAPA